MATKVNGNGMLRSGSTTEEQRDAQFNAIVAQALVRTFNLGPLLEYQTWHCITIVAVCACIIYSASTNEGIRLQQYPFLLAFLLMSLVVLFEVRSYFMVTVYLAVILLILAHNVIYGEVNFKGFRLNGKWQVGHQDMYTRRDGVAVSAYYPVEIEDWNRIVHREGDETKWLRYGA